MSSVWDEPAAPRASGGGDFLKVEVGQTVTLAVIGEPVKLTKPGFNPGDKPRRRVYALAYNFAERKVKVWDMAASTFEDVKAVHREAPVTKHAIKLSRVGAGQATEWKVVAVVKPIPAETLALIAAAPTPDLLAIAEATGTVEAAPAPKAGAKPAEAAVADDDIPF